MWPPCYYHRINALPCEIKRSEIRAAGSAYARAVKSPSVIWVPRDGNLAFPSLPLPSPAFAARLRVIPSNPNNETFSPSPRQFLLWPSARSISIGQLHALLHFHPCPIYLVVFKGSYFFRMGVLISRGASRLDAFSVYPFRTWLPCPAPGSATGPPAVRPSRSSRTKDSSFQNSCAHAG